MTTILLLASIALWRPEYLPPGDAEIRQAREIETDAERLPPTATVLTTGDIVPGRFVIGFEPGYSHVALRRALAVGTVVRVDGTAGWLVAATDSSTSVEDFGELTAGLRYVEPDCRVAISYVPNDPHYRLRQWDKYIMYADLAWDVVTGGTVKVAVVDNGVDYEHPDLAANFNPNEPGYDFVRGDADPRPDNTMIPESFHGTHVAGIIAAVMNNAFGVAGWAQVRLYAVRCLNDSGQGYLSDVASGIRWAVDHGVRAINLSLGSTSGPQTLRDACQYAAGRNVLLLAAAGNAGVSGVQYPAAFSECVAVGATDKDSRLAAFSNYGDDLELVAPGVDIYSTSPNATYVEADGTSMATPEVTGVASLMLAADPTLTAVRARSLLAASAVDMGVTGRDPRYGYGLANARRALDLTQLLRRTGIPAATRAAENQIAVRSGINLPEWVSRVTISDASGRMVLSGSVAGRSLSLRPGVWFCRMNGRESARTLRVLVAD